MTAKLLGTLLAWLVIATLPACAAGGAAGGARDVRLSSAAASGDKPVVTQAELQQDLERFTGDLISRITEAAESLVRDGSPRTRDRAMRQVLLYESSALDIATGPLPEVSVLDMMVFVGLSRGVFERYWQTELGEASRPLLAALQASEASLQPIAAKVMTTEQRQRLQGVIDEWLRANPDRISVEAVRFNEFSELAGKISSERAEETRGLFGSVKSATQAADEMLLLADRMRFLALRVPFLLRLHTRLGASEMTSDALARLDEVERSLAKLPEARPLVHDLTSLSVESRHTVEEARAVLDELAPIVARLPPPEEIKTMLGSVERLDDKTLLLLQRLQGVLGQVDALLPGDPEAAHATMRVAEQRFDQALRKAALYLIAIGAAWSLLFWGGYYAVKRLLARRRPDLDSSAAQS